MSTRLLLIRHAHIDVGKPPRLCGSLDVPLSAAGRKAVSALRVKCRCTEPPAALYSSPLVRARETADVLASAWRLEARVEPGLAEIHCGRLEGVRLADIEREYRSLWARNRAQDDEDFTWPGGESYRQFRARILKALGRIAVSHAGERIAVVTHAGVVAQVLGAIRGRSAAVWEVDRPDPLTVTEVSFVKGEPGEVLIFNRHDWC